MQKLIALSLLASLSSGLAQGSVIHFDELGVPGWVYPDFSNTGFVSQGFVFSDNMDVIDVSPSGGVWSNGVGAGHSGNYAAFNDYGGTMLMTRQGGGVFVVDTLWLNGWQGEAMSSVIEGYLNGALVGSVFAGYSSPWSQVHTGFGSIDTLSISGGYFLVDDIAINDGSQPLPEPATLLLLSLGLLGMACRGRCT
jgi:hypothetical protein